MSRRLLGHLGSSTRRRCTPHAAAAFALAVTLLAPPSPLSTTVVEAKTPGKTYCYYRTCHRVMTLDETRRAVGRTFTLMASHYDDPWKDRFNPRNLTSSGEWFRSGATDNAASPKLPNGTVILAWNAATRQAAVIRINNAGPYWGNRTLDVARGAAERLGFAKQGVAKLHVKVVHAPSKAEATYKKGRRYAAVPGHIGAFETIELAALAAGKAMGLTPELQPMPAPAIDPTAPVVVAALPQAAEPAATAVGATDALVDTTLAVFARDEDLRPTSSDTREVVASTVPSLATGPLVTPALTLVGAAGALGVSAASTLSTQTKASRSTRAARKAAAKRQASRARAKTTRTSRPKVAAVAPARTVRLVRRPAECQDWDGPCSVTVSTSSRTSPRAASASRIRVASSSAGNESSSNNE